MSFYFVSFYFVYKITKDYNFLQENLLNFYFYFYTLIVEGGDLNPHVYVGNTMRWVGIWTLISMLETLWGFNQLSYKILGKNYWNIGKKNEQIT